MPKGFKLDWKGDDVLKQVVKATKDGIDEVMGDCVVDAQADTPVVTGLCVGASVHRNRPTKRATRWSADVNYALPVEVGARGPWAEHAAERYRQELPTPRGDDSQATGAENR